MANLSQPALLGLREKRLAREGRDPSTGRTGDPMFQAPRTVIADPNWQAWFESINQAADGRDVKFAGGRSAPGSNQMRGQKPLQPSLLGIPSIANDPTSTFNDNNSFGPNAPYRNADAEQSRNAAIADDYARSWKGRR